METYIPRLVDGALAELLGEVPAIMLVGPRATGKTTTARRHAATVVRLDREREAVAFRADPDAALRGLQEPVLLDEWQAVPGVLGAVKRSVDDHPRPGRYIVTGSVRGDIDAPTWPGTGRLIRLTMLGLTVKEVSRGASEALLDRVRHGRIDRLVLPQDPPDLRGYIELALRGGFPEMVLGRSAVTRAHWISSYIDQLVSRDPAQVGEGPDPARLRRYLEALASHTAYVVGDRTLYEAAGITKATARAYERLLRNLLVLSELPAWTSNRLKRLTRAGKRYLTDPSLVSGTLGVAIDGVIRDGTLLGRLLDTFVVAQIRAEAALAAPGPRLHHLRAEQGRHEVDLVAEYGTGDLVAIEVKADAAPGRDAIRHLEWFRDATGDRFIAGLVLHTGPRVYQLGRLIWCVPICALWS